MSSNPDPMYENTDASPELADTPVTVPDEDQTRHRPTTTPPATRKGGPPA